MRPFLTAEWRHLLMLNYAVAPGLLAPWVPRGVELDPWNGTIYVSMVGFLFLRTRVLGLPMPWHTNFEEVNLRFYVRRRAADGWRRGVVFIREIVPRRIIAGVARICYNEPYSAMPMRHRIDSGWVEYEWFHQGVWNSLRATTLGESQLCPEGSEGQFITEHYWGYTAQRNESCQEYAVEHPRWKVWPVRDAALVCEVAALYGREFVGPLGEPPRSAFVAEGSAITVSPGVRLSNSAR